MRRLVFLSAATTDLTHILHYISKESGSRVTAHAFVEALRGHSRKLASLPDTLGRPRPDLRPDMRSSPFRGHVIFFRYMEDRLEVVNILDARGDIDAFFDEA